MMEDALEVRFVVSEDATGPIAEAVTRFAETIDGYDLLDVEEDGMAGNTEVYFESDDTLVHAIIERRSEANGVIVRFRLTIGGALQNTTELSEAGELLDLIDATADFYRELEDYPKAAYGVEASQTVDSPVSADDLPPTEREFLTWLDVFPTEEADRIGRDRLLSAPAPHVQELSDGSVLVAAKHPATTDPEPLDAVADHVGIGSWEDYPDERASRTDVTE